MAFMGIIREARNVIIHRPIWEKKASTSYCISYVAIEKGYSMHCNLTKHPSIHTDIYARHVSYNAICLIGEHLLYPAVSPVPAHEKGNRWPSQAGIGTAVRGRWGVFFSGNSLENSAQPCRPHIPHISATWHDVVLEFYELSGSR